MNRNRLNCVSVILTVILLASTFAIFHVYAPTSNWQGYVKPSFPDYAPSGMPDFDEKQDNWGPGYPGGAAFYTWCGPVATANALWWLDSEYESIVNLSPVAPPTISDHFALVPAFSNWDDHDPRNVAPFVPLLASLMDTDGMISKDMHVGTRWTDLANGTQTYLKIQGLSRYFEVHNSSFPTFTWIDTETEKCQGVVLFLEFYQWSGGWMPFTADPSLEHGHFVTCAGVNATLNETLISDPYQDAFEMGTDPLGRQPVAPAVHNPSVHNDTQYVSQDGYNVSQWSGPPPSPYGVPVSELVGYLQTMGYPGTYHAFIRAAIATSPTQVPEWPGYIKPGFPDYAPSGTPDFDERQGQTYNWSNLNTWSHCAPVAVANCLWSFDSEFETNTVPPPTISDSFRLVSSYNSTNWDDHDPRNAPFLVEHLAYLMDTDGQRTIIPALAHTGTNVTDMQTGLAQYLSWTGVNPIGDVNGDGVVNATDLNIVVAANNTAPGAPGWNMAADIYPATLGWPTPGRADNHVNQSDVDLVKAHMGQTGMFRETTVPSPGFDLIENEVEKCDDVILTVGFWIYSGGVWTRENYTEPYPNTGKFGHVITLAGVNSTASRILISDPAFDAFETGLVTDGRIPVPHMHAQPEPPYTTHNNAKLVSQDAYSVAPIPGCPGGNWAIMGYPPAGGAGFFAVIENAVVVSPVHDIAVTNVSAFRGRTVLFQGFSANVTVTVENHGGYFETFNVTVYANMTATANVTKIGKLINVALNGGSIASLTCMWNATGFAKWNATTGFGNYTLIACSDPLPGETHIEDNNFTDGCMLVTMVGDLVGKTGVPDGTCSTLDISVAAKCFGGYPGCPPPLMWNVNCDVTGINLIPDDKIGILDISVVAKQFGKSDP